MHKTQNSWLAHSYFFFSFLYACIIIQNSGGARIIVLQNSSFSEENMDCSPLCLLPPTEKHSLSAEIDTLSLYIFQTGTKPGGRPSWGCCSNDNILWKVVWVKNERIGFFVHVVKRNLYDCCHRNIVCL